jgi:DNA modification methylase
MTAEFIRVESAVSADLVETRNPRSVWTIPTHAFSGAHFATFPPELAERCITAGCPVGGVVLDPFGGAGTVGLVADGMRRDAVLIELDQRSVLMADERIRSDCPLFAEVQA